MGGEKVPRRLLWPVLHNCVALTLCRILSSLQAGTVASHGHVRCHHEALAGYSGQVL